MKRATVGRFDIIRLLGRGGMAAVYLAYDLKLDRRVALKVMLPQLEFTEGMSERFAREARTAARLDHRNIMVVHDVIEVEDLVLLVMNLISGASMEQVVPFVPPTPGLAAHQLPLGVVQSVLMHVATALEYAHGERVIHRDIKPSNVMITVRGDAIITDFGIAKVSADIAHTNSSTLMGTPTYMSPEQWKGQPVSGASDQYSLGVMAYELLLGEPPFIGTMLEVQNAHVDREPVPPNRRRSDVPARLSAAVMRMLAKRPAERFASMHAFIEELSAGYDPNDAMSRKILGAAAVTAVTTRDAVLSPDQTPRGPMAAIPPRPAKIVVVAPDTVIVGETFAILTSVKDATGAELDGVSITLTSENPNVAVINAFGAVATAPGTTRIVATGGGVWGEASVHVIARAASSPAGSDTTVAAGSSPPPVARLVIGAVPKEIGVGRSFQLTAMAFNERGGQVSGRRMSWTSDAPSIARISENGFVKALRPGVVKFACECGGIVSTARIEVLKAQPVGYLSDGDDNAANQSETTPITEGDVRRDEKARVPTRRGRWRWVAAIVLVIGIAIATYMSFKPPIAAVPVDQLIGSAARDAIRHAGYSIPGPGVTEEFTNPSPVWSGMGTRDGRIEPPSDPDDFYQDVSWAMGGPDFVVHFDVRSEVSRVSDGSGLYLGTEDGAQAYLLLFRNTSPPTYRFVMLSDRGIEDIVRPAPTGVEGAGIDRVDILSLGGTVRVWINDKFMKETPLLRQQLDGRFGLYVAPGEKYSFDNIAAAPLRKE